MGIVSKTTARKRNFALLRQEHLIGRRPICDLVLSSTSISSTHALLRWSGSDWFVRDLGSRNGTFVRPQGATSATLVPSRGECKLSLHDRIIFAEVDEEWELINNDAPTSVIINDASDPFSTTMLDSRGLTAIHATADCFATVYLDSKSSKWVVEVPDQEPRELEDGDSFEFNGGNYRLILANTDETAQVKKPPRGPLIESMHLEISTSADEESAVLIVSTSAGETRSPSRTHLYLLSYLARKRLKDSSLADQSTPEENLGWVEVHDACRDIDLSSIEQLASNVFRCRKELNALGICDAALIVDRSRRGSLRIGVRADRLSLTTA